MENSITIQVYLNHVYIQDLLVPSEFTDIEIQELCEEVFEQPLVTYKHTDLYRLKLAENKQYNNVAVVQNQIGELVFVGDYLFNF